MEANKFITNETDNMLTQMNNKRIMTDDELKQIFGKDKNFTYADFECLIDSKVNVQDVYTKKYLQEIMEAYYGSSPEIAKDWYDKELERRVNEEKRKSDELIRQSQEQNRVLSWNQMKSDADDTIQDIENRMDSIENQFDSMVDGTGFATQEFVNENTSSLVDSAPETLNTLGKLANALNNDPNFYQDIFNKIKKKSNIGHKHTISDIENLDLDANAIKYNNESSNIVSNEVQGAIEEINVKAEKNELKISEIENLLENNRITMINDINSIINEL